MHDLLIRANIALYAGKYQDALDYLDQYRQITPAQDAQASMVLWLEAHAEADAEQRHAVLEYLVESQPEDDLYARMAAELLADEAAFTPAERRAQPSLRWLQVPLLLIVGAVLAVLGITIFQQTRTSPQQIVIVTETPVSTAVASPLPDDRSQQLVSEEAQVLYDGGILQLIAMEDASARVTDLRSGEWIAPVPGARFYALAAVFECRQSICYEPPEAEIMVQIDSGDLIPLREGVGVAGEPAMAPLALGRTTEGWLIFELPIVSRPRVLVITPVLADNTFGESVTIDLPAG